jgi:hypothetical protein
MLSITDMLKTYIFNFERYKLKNTVNILPLSFSKTLFSRVVYIGQKSNIINPNISKFVKVATKKLGIV